MIRATRWLAGSVFGLAVAALVPFLIEKGTAPRGHAVLWLLYGAIAVSLVVWCAASLVDWKMAPRPAPLEIAYSFDGHSEISVPFRKGRPQSLLVSVGLRNPNPYNLDGVAINCLFPQGLRAERCGAHGESLGNPKGHWLSTPERLAGEPAAGTHKDYWADENLTVAGNGSKLLFFRVRVNEPGRIHLLTRVFGNVPPSEAPASLEIVETESMIVGGIINELICAGEALAAPSENVFLGNKRAYEDWKTELIFATAFLPDEDRRWWEAATAEDVPGSDDVWRRNMAARDVPVLYDLRRRLDRPREPADH